RPFAPTGSAGAPGRRWFQVGKASVPSSVEGLTLDEETTLQAMVRLKGLEPSHLSAPEPKSGASTNFATAAGVPAGSAEDSIILSDRLVQPSVRWTKAPAMRRSRRARMHPAAVAADTRRHRAPAPRAP